METIIEAILEVPLFSLLVYPGAFIRWIVMGCKKPYKVVAGEKVYWNGVLGFLIIAGIILLIRNLF